MDYKTQSAIKCLEERVDALEQALELTLDALITIVNSEELNSKLEDIKTLLVHY